VWRSDNPGFYVEITGGLHPTRIPLVHDVFVYPYTDPTGEPETRYKWRFSANGLAPLSGFHGPISGVAPPLAGVDLSTCTAQFIGLDGKPQKRRIVIVSDQLLSLGGNLTGAELPLIVDSDDFGYLQVSLVQGAVVRVAIEGTAFVREFTVPSTDTFDLLAVMAAAPDPFTVQVPLPFLNRRSL
jgi:hypothetical protein